MMIAIRVGLSLKMMLSQLLMKISIELPGNEAIFIICFWSFIFWNFVKSCYKFLFFRTETSSLNSDKLRRVAFINELYFIPQIPVAATRKTTKSTARVMKNICRGVTWQPFDIEIDFLDFRGDFWFGGSSGFGGKIWGCIVIPRFIKFLTSIYDFTLRIFSHIILICFSISPNFSEEYYQFLKLPNWPRNHFAY